MTSDADLIHAVNAQLPSWNVSAVAQLAGKEVVHHEEYVEESRKYVFRERDMKRQIRHARVRSTSRLQTLSFLSQTFLCIKNFLKDIYL